MARSWSTSSGSLIMIMIVGLVILASVESVMSLKCYKCSGPDECKNSSLEERACSANAGDFCKTETDPSSKVVDKGCAGQDSNNSIKDGACDEDPSGSGAKRCYCATELCNGNGGGGGGGGGSSGKGGGSVAKPACLWTNLLWIGFTCFYSLSMDKSM